MSMKIKPADMQEGRWILIQGHPGTIRQNYGRQVRQNYGRQVYRSYGVNKAAKKFRGFFEAGQSGRENPETADRGDSIKILIIVEQGHPILDCGLGDEAIDRLSYGDILRAILLKALSGTYPLILTDQRVIHGCIRKTAEIPVCRPNLPYPVCPAKGCNSGIMYLRSGNVTFLQKVPDLQPVVSGFRQQDE